MKKIFVRTDNVKKFITMMNNLQNRAEGVPGMGLVYGEPGLGKTQTINWWAFKYNASLIRCAKMMSPKWLLSEILKEMDEIVPYRFSDCFNLIIRNLLENPQVLIFDEIDYLTVDSTIIETIRDIHDKTNVPIVLVGMAQAKSRIRKFKHLYDRLSEIVEFEPFDKNDIGLIVKELSEVEMTDCAIKYIAQTTTRFRQIVKLINKAELIAKANGINSIDEVTLEEVAANEVANPEIG